MQKLTLKLNDLSVLEKGAIEITKKLQEAGFEAYFAGGAVRDLFLKRSLRDIDIATSAKPDEVKDIFPGSSDRGKAFGVVVVRLGEFEYEIATFRTDVGVSDHRHPEEVRFVSAEEDANRRDFTINALFFDPKKSEIIDYVDGIKDLTDGVVKFVGDPKSRINEDYLRIIRAVRFAARLSFKIEKETHLAIKENAAKINDISIERTREELTNILINDNRVEAIKLLDELGLLKVLLPEIVAMKGVAQSPEFHSEGDVYEHTLLALSKIEKATPELVWTVLLHDVGKPLTKAKRDVPGRPNITFYEHDNEGSKIAKQILERLKFSSDFIAGVSWAIEQHMRIVNAFRGMSERKQLKLFTHPHSALLLDLTKYDLGSSLRPGLKVDLTMYRNALEKKDHFEKEMAEAEKEQIKKFDLITGKDIMQILNIPAGPKVGQIKTKIEEAFLEGKISAREEALKMIESFE